MHLQNFESRAICCHHRSKCMDQQPLVRWKSSTTTRTTTGLLVACEHEALWWINIYNRQVAATNPGWWTGAGQDVHQCACPRQIRNSWARTDQQAGQSRVYLVQMTSVDTHAPGHHQLTPPRNTGLQWPAGKTCLCAWRNTGLSWVAAVDRFIMGCSCRHSFIMVRDIGLQTLVDQRGETSMNITKDLKAICLKATTTLSE